jgi:hypothetical protein
MQRPIANLRWLPLLLLLLLPAMAAAQAASVALVLKVSGEVSRQPEGGEAAPLANGARLDDGDRLRTGEDGRAVLVFTDDRSQLKLTPNTDLVLRVERQAARSDKEVELSAGTIWSKVTRQQGEFRIATPTSVASVKGTAWWTREQDGLTEIIAEEGIVQLTGRLSGASVDVPMGHVGRSDGESTSLRPTTPEDEQDLERGELKRVEIPVLDDGQPRTLIIEYYE